MRKVSLFVFFAIAIFLALNPSLAHSAKKDKKGKNEQNSVRPPDWVFGKSAAYPEGRFMTATGSAQFEKSADSDALTNFASVFGQVVSSTAGANRKMRQDTDDSVSKESEFAQSVQVRVDESELIGVEIKERFFDGKKYYSLAVMDKAEAAKLYKAAVDANNRDIARLEAYSKDDQFSMERCSNLFIAQGKAEQNKRYIDRMFVIDSDEAKAMKTKSPQELRAQRIEVARQIPIYVHVSGDTGSFVEKELSEMLTSFGFRFSKDSAERYRLEAVFSMEQKLSKDKESHQTFFSLSCALRDSALSASLWSDSYKGRSSSFSQDDSLDRAKTAIEKKTQGDLAASFENFLRGSR